MITGRVENWTSVLNTDIPFITELKTNNKVLNKDGLFSIVRNGIYNIDANLVVLGVAGDVTARIIADGEETDIFAQASLADASAIATLPLTDAIRVIFDTMPNVATISVRLDVAGLNTSGNIRIEYVQ